MTQIELEIFKLCREINRKTKHSVFYDFSGHVDSVDIRINIDGWYSEDDKKKIYLDCGSTMNFYEWESENFKIIKLHYYIDLATLEDLRIIKDELGKLLPKESDEE